LQKAPQKLGGGSAVFTLLGQVAQEKEKILEIPKQGFISTLTAQ